MRYVGIDPSTRTGLVILDKHGELINAEEITAEGTDPGRMVDIIEQISQQLELGDIIAIEGFSHGSKGAAVDVQYGIGWGIRMDIYNQNTSYVEVSPSGLKKFASGKGTTSKDNLVLPIFKRWGFEHASDNVRDAYVLAQVARAIRAARIGLYDGLTTYQKDVIAAIVNPPKQKTSKKRGA